MRFPRLQLAADGVLIGTAAYIKSGGTAIGVRTCATAGVDQVQFREYRAEGTVYVGTTLLVYGATSKCPAP